MSNTHQLLSAEEAEDESEEDIQEILPCKFCEYETPNVDDLDEHIITHEEAVLEDDEEDEEALSDNIMNSAPGNGNSAIEEVRELTNSNSTSNESVTAASAVTGQANVLPAYYHKYAEAKNKLVYVCPYCGYQTMKYFDLHTHLRDHSAPVYSCSECNYTTKSKLNINKHLQLHCVTNVPWFKCKECPYRTVRKYELTRHLLNHEGNNVNKRKFNCIFKCTECGYTSKRLNDVQKHAVLHCDRTVKGVFKCTKCDYASAVGSHFATHVLSQCKIKKKPESIFPKESTMQEYIVLEEEELDLYQLDKDSIASVEVPQKNATVLKPGRKRKIMKEDRYGSLKKANLNYYMDVNDDGFEDTNIETESSKVVVLPGYDEDCEQNVEN